MDASGPSEYRALVVGIEGPRPSLSGESAPEHHQLPYAPRYAAELAGVLGEFGYEIHSADLDPAGSADALEKAVKAVIGAGPGFVVVHILGHGVLGRSSRGVYVVGGDGERTTEDIEHWIRRVEDAEPEDRTPYVLFLLDLCYAGTTARLHWQHEGRPEERRAWVISAGDLGEETYDGRLTLAVTKVLTRFARQTMRVEPTSPCVPFHLFCRQYQDEMGKYAREGYPQRSLDPLLPASQSDVRHLAFFPNPGYDSGGSAVTERPAAAALSALLDEVADAAHFTGRASGVEAVFRPGEQGFFRGREAEVRTLAAWLRGEGQDLRVVTGKPGTGKSALLGTLVCAAHPVLRSRTRGLWWRVLADPPPEVAGLAVVHARRRSVAEVMRSLGRQWELGTTRCAGDVVSALREPRGPKTLILDALDEAEDPDELMGALLELGEACRMLVGVRSGKRFNRLIRAAGPGRVDLDKVTKNRLGADLSDYLYDVLTVKGPYAAAERERTARLLADGVAQTLVRRRMPAYGEFLLAALYVRHVLDRPGPADSTDVPGICEAVPRTLEQAQKLHLAQHRDVPWLPAVLAALAFAQGAGMPEEVVMAAAAAFGDGLPGIEQIREALEAAQFYLRHDVDDEARTLYRLFHQGLADGYRSRPGGAEAVWARLLGLVGTPARWESAEPYLLRHAVQHASEAGRLPELLDDVDFTLHVPSEALERLVRQTEGPRILPKWVRRARARGLPPLTRLYVDIAAAHRGREPAERRQILTVEAARRGEETVARSLTPNGPFRARRIGRMPQFRRAQPVPTPDMNGPQVVMEDTPSVVTGLVPVSEGGRPHLLTASGDGVIRLWDLRERSLVARGAYRRDRDEDTTAACATVGPHLVSLHSMFRGMFSGTSVNTWELPDLGSPRKRSGLRDTFLDVTGVTVHDRPTAVLCGSRVKRDLSGLLVLWDPSEHRQLGEPLLDEGAALSCVAAAQVEGRPHAVTGGGDGVVRVWDLEERRQTGALTGHRREVSCVAVVPLEGRPHAVTGGDDGVVRVWDLEERRQVQALTGHERPVSRAAVGSAEGRPLALTCGADRTLRLWDLTSGTPEDVVWLPEEPRALTVTTDDTVVISLTDTVVALELGLPLRPFSPHSVEVR